MGGSASRRLILAGATCALALAVPASGASAATSGSGFSGVACPSGGVCFAVGSHTTTLGATVPLAEYWNGKGWALRAVPLPSGAVSAQLNGISCSLGNVDVCEAVGSYADGSGHTVTLAERWNGRAWSVRPAPNPSGATVSELNGVSCSNPTSCFAVGDRAGKVYSLHWNGASWTGQPFPRRQR